jgi:CMD domain protein
MPTATPDIIDHLAGIMPGSELDRIRAARQQARDNAQASYLALFEPATTDDVSLEERFALASFVAGLHKQDPELDFYAGKLAQVATNAVLTDAVMAEIEAAKGGQGPAGHYPPGPLSAEDTEGLVHKVSTANRAVLGERIATALEHAHLLVFRPRDAAPVALQALLDAGWSTTGIVTLSQIVAFLSFQLRVILGLRTLAATPPA